MTINKWWQGQREKEKMPTALPPGVRLLCTLEGHRGPVKSVAFDPQGRMLARGV
jgi:hypothetical protein